LNREIYPFPNATEGQLQTFIIQMIVIKKKRTPFWNTKNVSTNRMHPAWHRKTGHKMDDAIEELSITGKENVIHHFDCIL